jgi:hypothetical protein
LLLVRLVGIGVAADMDDLGDVFRLGQLALQQLAGLGLEIDLGLEIQAGRVAQIGVGRPGVAVDAAVAAAAIGIDRTLEADVGTVVAGDDGPRLHRLQVVAIWAGSSSSPQPSSNASLTWDSKRPVRLDLAPRPRALDGG